MSETGHTVHRSRIRRLLVAGVIAVVGAPFGAPAAASACPSLDKPQAFMGTVSTSFTGTASGSDGGDTTSPTGTATVSLDRQASLQVQVQQLAPEQSVFEGRPTGGTVTVNDQYSDSVSAGSQTASGPPQSEADAVILGSSLPQAGSGGVVMAHECEYQLFISWAIPTTESGTYPYPPDLNPGAGGTGRTPFLPIPASLELTGSVTVPVYTGDPGRDQPFYGIGLDSFAQPFDTLTQCHATNSVSCAPPGTPDGSATISWHLSPIELKCVVPKLKGDTLAQAKSTLGKAACKLGKVTFKTSLTVPDGRVISSEPAAGKKLDVGEKVDLVISQPPCVVPTLSGRLGSEATKLLSAANCTLGKVTNKYSFTGVGKGKIVSSSPSAGSKLGYGTPVAVTVSLGPAHCSVPKFLPGLTVLKAKTFLSNTNNFCTLGKIAYQSSTAFAKGTVITSKPTPGASKLPAGTPVALTVSSGP